MICTLPIHRTQTLTWHDGGIPKDEVWVKLGGDKGGGTFKMSFQVNASHRSICSKFIVVYIQVFVFENKQTFPNI